MNFKLIALLLLINAPSFAQSEKNDLKISVSALPLFGSSAGFESGTNGFVIKPALGYFISDKTSIELNFTYASLRELSVGGVASRYNSYGVIPGLRHNFLNKRKFRLFAELGFGLGTIKYEADEENLTNPQHEELSGGISIFNVGLGINYFFNDKFGLEVIIPYLSTRNITSENIDNLYSGIGPTLGLTYKLN